MADTVNVNDGKGLFDNEGLIDTLILDCNSIVKDLAGGECVRFCSRIVQMVQKLSNLKTAMREELESKDEQIRQANRLTNDILEAETGLPVDRDNEKKHKSGVV